MDLYSLEFFIEKLDVASHRIQKNDFNVKVTCSDLIDITIKYFIKNSAQNVLAGRGCGKAVVFCSSFQKLISDFTDNLRVAVAEVDGLTNIGVAHIYWGDDFEQQVRNFGKGTKFVQHSGKYNLRSEGNDVGTIQVTKCLVFHGENIEIPINYLGSQINIPLTFRRKTYASHCPSGQMSSEVWKPLFYEKKKPTKSVMDPDMEMYATLAGVPVQPPMSTLLTPDYINKNLCGHKTCPGAQKFKEYGLGPLCPPGSGLGTITSFQNTKPLGLYGMSQAYGTLDAYGAYGMFVKKPTKPKTCCGSPDCPYTIFYGKPDPQPSVDDMEVRPKKCQCKNCKKNNGSSRQSSKSSTCGSPKCPRNTPPLEEITCPFLKPPIEPSPCCTRPAPKQKKEVACPFQPNRQARQSAGADRYNADCPDTSCPYSTAQQRRQSANGRNGSGVCGGRVCPLESNGRNGGSPNDLNELISLDFSTRTNGKNGKNGGTGAGTCGGRVCPFEPSSVPVRGNRTSVSISDEETPEVSSLKCLGRDTCPNFASPKKNGTKRKSISEDPVNMANDAEECPDTCLYYPKKKKNCKDKECPYYKPENCKDKECPYYKPENCKDLDCHIYNEDEEEEEEGSCGGTVCPLDRERRRKPKDAADIFSEFRDSIRRASKDPEFNQKKLSLLINEEGKKLLISGNGDNNRSLGGRRDTLASMSLADNSDIYMLISRLVGERQQTTSMNNYFTPDGIPSSPDMLEGYKDKKRRKGPCSKDSCRALKYKTCSECGGVSKSGATCDNTDVSFSTISYDDSYATRQEMTPKTDESKTVPESSLKKKVETVPTKEKLSVKIVRPRKRRTRFVYNEGESYPGVKLGHKKCSTATKNVPAHMGWLWNIKGDWERRRRKNYRPGKVSKTVEERIIQNRRAKGIPDPPELTMLVKKKKFKLNPEESESDEEDFVPKPTLTIEKKEGNYLITMNPLKDPKTLADNEYPYMRCKPMQFLILKPKKEPPPAPPVPRYSEYDGEDGEDYQPFYDSCLCDADKNSASSSSSESELNIEFTTPAGIITPERLKKMINVVMVENQFKEADFHCNDCPTIVPTIYKKERKKKKK